MAYRGDTTIHRVLQIPELLDMVFSFLDRPSNAINARICKKWSEIALDVLWRDVDDLGRLFGLLVPFRIGAGINPNHEHVSSFPIFHIGLNYIMDRNLLVYLRPPIGSVSRSTENASDVWPTKPL